MQSRRCLHGLWHKDLFCRERWVAYVEDTFLQGWREAHMVVAEVLAGLACPASRGVASNGRVALSKEALLPNGYLHIPSPHAVSALLCSDVQLARQAWLHTVPAIPAII